MIPRGFTYPFRYVPCEEIVEESRKLISEIDSSEDLKDLFGEGKMLGILLTDKGFLHAFSGLAKGRSTVAGFVPPIFDYAREGGFFRRREAEISAMPQGKDKSEASARLQDWLFEQYVVSNALGESLSIKEIFARKGMVPPGGTGECAAPKLLQYAYSNGMKPLAMGEFWFGDSPRNEVREQGRFYPSCIGKCGPLLSFMTEGLEMEPNPLDEEYTFTEPDIIYEDKQIIVVDKPSGMLAVPGRGRRVSLLERLQEKYGEVHSCHRLDMDTSGVIVYARTLEAKKKIEAQFAAREVRKTYRLRLAAASRPFRHARQGTIALPLAPDWYDRPRQMVDREHGKQAITVYEVLEMLPNGEIEVRMSPRTGRTHQLRVHAAHKDGLGRPIKGDKLYGDCSKCRLHLHAESLELEHPSSGERMTFRSPKSYDEGHKKEMSCNHHGNNSC